MVTELLLQPLSDRVLIRRDASDAETPGGIVLPDAAKQDQGSGIVIAVGPGQLLQSGERAPMQVSEGTLVFFENYGGSEIEHNGESLLLIRESDLLARIE